MDRTLKVANVFSDPTRLNIYEHLVQSKDEVSVLDVAEAFNIHPNVARLHLSKLEEIHVIQSSLLRTGKGGRPSRMYELSNNVVELNFPHRDYKMLSLIAFETFAALGEEGEEALYRTGKKYGEKLIRPFIDKRNEKPLTIDEKLFILEEAGTMTGLYPHFTYDENKREVFLHIQNCPFKEVATSNPQIMCEMHKSFIKGMFNSLFDEFILTEQSNLFKDCESCSYRAKLITN
ncbi:MAG TPA: helix-turn-helix domain-containing protein [Bacillota bacterium]|nr:helix-turn-helix domain-containing protein [Bacillota bacterium]